jgi:DNA adenine methylase
MESSPPMKCSIRKMRSPLKYHGGKHYLARRIVALFPEHKTYVEPFIGGGSILLNKAPAEQEIAGDINAALINFWTVLQQDSGFRCAVGHPYSADTFEQAECWMEAPEPLSRAAGFMIRNRFSRGGLGKDFAWSDRLRGGQPGDLNAWKTIREELPAIIARVKSVEFKERAALPLICRFDSPDALIYCDPPYLHETRTAKKAYDHEMTSVDHHALLDTLKGCEGKVFLSGYRSATYDKALAGWKRTDFDMPNHSGQGKSKQRRIECVWENRA